MSELKHTQRGFAYIEFQDHYDNKCSLQKSSLAFEDAIWFGIDDANPQVMAIDAKSVGVETEEATGWVPYKLPAAVSLTTRMHLTQDQVRELLPTLIHFAETGDVLAPADCRAQPEANADAKDAITDTQRIDHIEAWSTNNKARNMHWNTFCFDVDSTVREQLDAAINADRQAKEKGNG